MFGAAGGAQEPPRPVLLDEVTATVGDAAILWTKVETVAVNIPQVAELSAITTRANAKTIVGYSDVTTGAKLADINLLSGLIRAEAVETISHVRKSEADNVAEAQTNFVGLTIAGKKIPIDVKPNTQIYILGVAQVYVNQQLTKPNYSAVVGLRVLGPSAAQHGGIELVPPTGVVAEQRDEQRHVEPHGRSPASQGR